MTAEISMIDFHIIDGELPWMHICQFHIKPSRRVVILAFYLSTSDYYDYSSNWQFIVEVNDSSVEMVGPRSSQIRVNVNVPHLEEGEIV